ncbi:MAG: TlpA disulfide reductase family protein [bacterium]
MGSKAPTFSTLGFDSAVWSLADLRGKGVVMNFFASWCPPCRAEARDLEATYRRYRDRGIVFLGVDIEQDTWDDARAFLREFGITYPIVRDGASIIAKKYELYGLPTTYFIDKDGVIRSKYAGPFLGPEGLKVLASRIEQILP